MLSRRRGAAAALVVLAALVTTGAGEPANPLDGAMAELLRARRARDEEALGRAVRALGSLPDPRADRPLLRLAQGSPWDGVCAEAARALGDRGGYRNRAILEALVRVHRKRPGAVRGVLDGLAAYESPELVELFGEQAARFLFRDEETALAAIDALGRIPSREAVDGLVRVLGLTDPAGKGRRGRSGPELDSLDRLRARIYGHLRDLTGENWGDKDTSICVWETWWRGRSKDFEPPGRAALSNREDRLACDRHHFEITRPDEAWAWSDSPEDGFEMTARRILDGRLVARLSIHVRSALHDESGSVTDLVAEQRAALEASFSRIEEATWDEPCAFADRDARETRVAGVLEERAVRLRQTALADGTRIYLLRAVLPGDAPEEIEEELADFLGSFRLTR